MNFPQDLVDLVVTINELGRIAVLLLNSDSLWIAQVGLDTDGQNSRLQVLGVCQRNDEDERFDAQKRVHFTWSV
jgi:hypothetical protein